MIEIIITHIRKSKNNIFEQWQPYNKTVPDMGAVEMLMTLNKHHHQVDAVDFVTVEKNPNP